MLQRTYGTLSSSVVGSGCPFLFVDPISLSPPWPRCPPSLQAGIYTHQLNRRNPGLSPLATPGAPPARVSSVYFRFRSSSFLSFLFRSHFGLDIHSSQDRCGSSSTRKGPSKVATKKLAKRAKARLVPLGPPPLTTLFRTPVYLLFDARAETLRWCEGVGVCPSSFRACLILAPSGTPYSQPRPSS